MGVLSMDKGFWQVIRQIGGTTLGVAGLWLGLFNSSVQGVAFAQGLTRNGSQSSEGFMLAQDQPPIINLDFQTALLPSLTSEDQLSPTFSDLQLLPDLFLPRYPSFNSQLLDQQLILYSIHLFLSGPPDVLIVGSSRAIQGVDPKVLQQSLMAQGHPELDIYNFSINGATAQVIDLLLREILTRDQLPKLVIWADGSRAFNSGRPDRTYTQIAESDGFKQLANGMHPILVHSVEAIAPSVCQDQFDPTLSYQQYTSAGPQPPQSMMVQSAMGVSVAGVAGFLSFAPALPKLASKSYTGPTKSTCIANASVQSFLSKPEATSWSSSNPHYEATDPLANYAPTPNHELIAYQSPSIDASISSLQHFVSRLPFDLEVNGFLPNLTEFEPRTYYQQYPYVAGDYDANYVPFQLQGIQTDATHQLAKSMREKQIPLAFVNLPLTQDYLDTTRSNYEAQFLQHMQQLASQAGFMFVDLNYQELSLNQYFADPSHLNAQGARAVATHLARQNDIPWPY